MLAEADAGQLAIQRRPGLTFAVAAQEWLRFCEHERACKPTTLRDYRHSLSVHLLPAFGDLALEDISTEASSSGAAACSAPPGPRTSFSQSATASSGAHDVPTAPAQPGRGRRPAARAAAHRPRRLLARGGPRARARRRVPTGRGDLPHGRLHGPASRRAHRAALARRRLRQLAHPRALSFAGGLLPTPKSGRLRSVPLSTQVATALARLAERGWSTGDDDLVFVGDLGGYVDGSALRRRYVDALAVAGLRPLRFNDLRHTFGTRMIAKADILRVKEWMGHADVQTTMRYLHCVPRPDDARLVDEAFALADPAAYSASVVCSASAARSH
jgi:integrase